MDPTAARSDPEAELDRAELGIAAEYAADELPDDGSGGDPSNDRRWQRRETGFKVRSSYGAVADSTGLLPPGADPWDQLRIKAVTGRTPRQLTEARVALAAAAAARQAFRPRIRSKSHPVVGHCKRLAKEQVRQREGVVAVEGVRMIATALDSGWEPELLFCAPPQAAALAKIRPELAEPGAITVGTADAVTAALVHSRLEPALAVGPPPNCRPRKTPRRAMLLGVQDPSNMGSLLRTGAALGVTTVYLLPGTPDPWNPRVIRASAAAAFMLEFGTERDALQAQLPVVCADAHHGDNPGPDRVPAGISPFKFMLALGHETRGLPEVWLERGSVLTLPSQIESLGVAAAGAILLDRLTTRGRGAGEGGRYM